MGSELLAAIITSSVIMIGGLLKVIFQLGTIEGRLGRVEAWIDHHD
jgi:hypothetical protein